MKQDLVIGKAGHPGGSRDKCTAYRGQGEVSLFKKYFQSSVVVLCEPCLRLTQILLKHRSY